MPAEPTFLTREIVDRIHVRSLNEFGGIHGVRNNSLVDSAIAEHRMTKPDLAALFRELFAAQ